MHHPKRRKNIFIRRAEVQDTHALVALMRTSLGVGKIPRSVAYWQWKHEDNPFGSSPVLVAEAPSGQVVGLRVFMRWTWQCAGRSVHAVRAVDTATHPDWRGQGIFTRLTMRLVEELTQEGVAFVFNTPNDKSRPGYLKMGWHDVGRVSLWVRPLHLGRLLGKLVGTPDAVAPVLGAFPNAATLADVPGLDAFLARVAPSATRYYTPRTTRYLTWRYADVPQLQYKTLWRFDPQEGGAGCVFRGQLRGGLRELSLSEVLVTPTKRGFDYGRDLVRHVVRHADADYAVAMAPWSSPAARVLLRSGFLPAPRLGPHYTARPLAPLEDLPDPTRRSSWHHFIGDIELF